MFSKRIIFLLINCLVIFLTACSDSENETNLVNRHTTASQDIISISFPADTTESILSINSEFDFTLEGLKSNGTDSITISSDVIWSLSDGASSTIDQLGHFIASANAELITLTAQFGFLTETLELKVSSAKFDKVTELNDQPISIDMCLSSNIKPIARYIDEDGNDEIRPVDSNTINTIEWIIRNQEDDSASQRAHISTVDNQASLHTLASGNIVIQARAISAYSGSELTSDDFIQSVDNNINNIKICNNSDTDLSSCSVSSISIEKDTSQALISVGTYQASDGSSYNTNISQNSKWGIDNSTNATIAFADDFQTLNVSGQIEASSAVLSVACGEITQNIDTIDISTGVALSNSVSCDGGLDCYDSTTNISITDLSVTSFEVTANDLDLTDDESTTLENKPDEITLIVTANYSNSSSADITGEASLIYSITAGDGDVIEEKTDSPGVYTVLSSGTVKIKLDYRTETFSVFIIIP